MSPLLLLLVACGPATLQLGDDPKDSGAGEDSSPLPPTPALELAGVGVLDPLLAPSTPVTLTEVGGDAVRLTVEDPDGAVVRTLADGTGWVGAVDWDARDDAGQPLPVGRYTLQGELLAAGEPVATSALTLHVVRVGVDRGTLGGERISLCWPDAGGTYFDGGASTPTFKLDSIDTVDAYGVRSATPIPGVWADLSTPPESLDNTNLPAAYPYNAVPTLALAVAGDLAGADVQVRIAGWTADADVVTPDDVVTFTLDGPLAPGLAVVEPTLTLEWMTADTVFATQSIPLRMYALLGPPAFEAEGAPYEPWPVIIDPLLRRVGSLPPSLPDVAAAVVDEVYLNQGLAYDTARGASAYVQYRNGYDDAEFDLSGFVTRRRGSIVNCTDCAAIVETFAGMLGADLAYAIIVQNYNLNYIKAIGGDSYSHCPFDNGGCSFRYHAVTTPDDAGTIYDATLTLDGDDDPGATPNEELFVHGVPGAEYLDRLVMSGDARYDYIQHGAFR